MHEYVNVWIHAPMVEGRVIDFGLLFIQVSDTELPDIIINEWSIIAYK